MRQAVPGDAVATPRPRLYRSPYLWAFLAGVTALTLMRPLLRFEPAPPPVLWELPPFELQASGGQPFGSSQLDGQVWIAGFFFSRCASICPRLVRSMATLDARLQREGVAARLVGITVDPDHDTPERLAAYGAELGLDPARFTLLTGPRAAIVELTERGFKVPVGPLEQEPAGVLDIAHSGKLALVDARGRVRGFYEIEGSGLDELFHRARQLLGERAG